MFVPRLLFSVLNGSAVAVRTPAFAIRFPSVASDGLARIWSRTRSALADERWAFLTAGVAMVGVGLLADRVPFAPYGPIDFWTVSPSLFLLKAGSVLIALSGAIAVTRRTRRLPRIATALSQESLTVYLLHLCVLYGSIWSRGLNQVVGARLGLWAVLGSAAFLATAMSLVAWRWYEFKREWRPVATFVRAALAAGLFYALT